MIVFGFTILDFLVVLNTAQTVSQFIVYAVLLYFAWRNHNEILENRRHIVDVRNWLTAQIAGKAPRPEEIDSDKAQGDPTVTEVKGGG